jgi:hypothetical protein
MKWWIAAALLVLAALPLRAAGPSPLTTIYLFAVAFAFVIGGMMRIEA